MRTLIAILVLLLPLPAHAQPLFTNPFGTAAAYRLAREALPDAHFRVRYRATKTEIGAAPVVSELVIDVAADWSLAREGGRTSLRDFQLNRMFLIHGDRFTSVNGGADLAFRVMERQNRTYLQALVAGAIAPDTLSDACDADAELGVALPGVETVASQVKRERGAVTVMCASRSAGGFIPGAEPAPPAAFWPTLFSEMTSHPAMFRAIRSDGKAPRRLEIAFRLAPDKVTRRVWELTGVERVSVAYPLAEGLQNITADELDRIVAPGVAQTAKDAVAGRAQSGPPTLETWGIRLKTVSEREGPAAAAMLLLPTYNMFPDLQTACASNAEVHPVCAINRGFRDIAQTDSAPMALLEVAMAEQSGNADAAIAAMLRAQSSPLRSHPALAASYALALLKFDDQALGRARAAGLPTDVSALQAQAVTALPYNPAYWTDIGDHFAVQYDWQNAMLLYDIAFSLPMPAAIAGNRVLVSKRSLMERLRADFPDASLPN